MTGLEVAKGFINAVVERDANAAAELCTEAVEVLLPGAEEPLRGREGVRQMIRMAPQFLQSMRDEEERDGEVRITTLTRAPGVFANYTTWLFVMDGDKIERLSLELRGATYRARALSSSSSSCSRSEGASCSSCGSTARGFAADDTTRPMNVPRT